MSRYRAPLIAVLVAVLLAVAFWFLAYQPKREERAALNQEITDIQAQQQRVRLQIAQLEEVARNELAVRSQLARLEQYVPTGIAQSTAIRQFQLTADASGVEIESVTFSEPVAIEGAPDTGMPGTVLGRISVTMSIEGGYFQAVDFLRRVEHDMRRAVLVGALSMDEGTIGYPSLVTTWTGDLFAVVPVAQTAEPDDGDDDGDDDEGDDGDDDEPEVEGTAMGAST